MIAELSDQKEIHCRAVLYQPTRDAGERLGLERSGTPAADPAPLRPAFLPQPPAGTTFLRMRRKSFGRRRRSVLQLNADGRGPWRHIVVGLAGSIARPRAQCERGRIARLPDRIVRALPSQCTR